MKKGGEGMERGTARQYQVSAFFDLTLAPEAKGGNHVQGTLHVVNLKKTPDSRMGDKPVDAEYGQVA